MGGDAGVLGDDDPGVEEDCVFDPNGVEGGYGRVGGSLVELGI